MRGSLGQSKSGNDIPFRLKHGEGAVYEGEGTWTHYQTRLCGEQLYDQLALQIPGMSFFSQIANT